MYRSGSAARVGFVACVAGTAAGVGVIAALSPASKPMFLVAAVLATAGAVIVFGVVAYFLAPGDLRAIAAAVASGGKHARKPLDQDGYIV